MKIKVEKAGPCRKIMEVTVPAETVAAEYATAVAAYVKNAKMPGYRPGRAPSALVERRYAREIDESVQEAVVAQTYPEALKRSALDPVAVLDLNVTLKRNESATYKVTLDVPPEFKLPKYKGISLKEKPADVSAEALQRAFTQWLERHASFEEVTGRPVAKGDAVQVDFEGRLDGRPLAALGKRVGALAQARDLWIMADESTPLPGFGLGLLDLAVGARREITVAFPADFGVAELAGKAAVYQVRVKAIRAKRLPTLDEQLLKKAGVASEAELRGKLKEALEHETQRTARERQKEEIIKHLLARTTLELPETLVQEEIRHQFSALVRQNLLRGVPREQLTEKRGDLLTAATNTATEKVKLGYILHRIAEEEKITLSDQELAASVDALAQRYAVPSAELRKELEEKKEMDSIRHQARMDKTLDFLLTESRGEEEEAGLFGRLLGR
ncbi:MAG: trigger factor [Lentisphaerae bacterium]|nr:trigger factor [Lentisphaerota bacterium]